MLKKIVLLMAIVALAGSTLTVYAGPDDRQDRRQERGRSDERQDRRECRHEEGVAGKDKRDCKQEEVRDGVRGKQGDQHGDGDDDQDKDGGNGQ